MNLKNNYKNDKIKKKLKKEEKIKMKKNESFWDYIISREWAKKGKNEIMTIRGCKEVFNHWRGKEINDCIIKESKEKDVKKTEPGEPADEIKALNEKAYQRAFYNYTEEKGRFIRLNLEEREMYFNIKWLDYEIPPVFEEKGRRKCFDLIGRIYTNEQPYVIAELKCKLNKNYGDNPLYALFECLFYGIKSIENKEILKTGNNRKGVCHKGKENYWKEFNEFPYLIVAANENYWKFWRENSSFEWGDFTDFLKRIEVKLPHENEKLLRELSRISLVEFCSINFECQKGGKNKYKPELPSKEHSKWKLL